MHIQTTSRRRALVSVAAAVASPWVGRPAHAGAEIRLGQTLPYSGPASSYGTMGRAQQAWFRKVNDEGGIAGRPITLLSLDDGYSPPKTVEQVRKLVEQENVLAMFQMLGTANCAAVQQYLNAHKVGQLFVSSGATQFNNPSAFPWTFPFTPSYRVEGAIYAKYLLQSRPAARVAILSQNDDFGRELVGGFKAAAAGAAQRLVVSEATYEPTDPTVDTQIIALQASGADTLIIVATPKFSAQAIRKAFDTGWRPTPFVVGVSSSVGSVLRPAGLEKAIGAVTVQWTKDPNDPQWRDDAALLEWRGFMGKYFREGDVNDILNVNACVAAHAMVQVLKQCGGEITREQIRSQAERLRGFRSELLLPGITFNTSPDDHAPIKQVRLARFDGRRWAPFTGVFDGSLRG